VAQAKRSSSKLPTNRIEGLLGKSASKEMPRLGAWTEKGHANLHYFEECHHGAIYQAEKHGKKELPNWAELAELLVERLTIEKRIESAEKEIKDFSARLTRLEGICERAFLKPTCVPIATFAPEPFEIIKDFSVVVQPEEDGFVATLFDANISSSGETQEEAVTNVKDLILMIFRSFENEDDGKLGPAMIRQKHALLGLVRRK
jgi:predicted RNase H-like HicB family nuclease